MEINQQLNCVIFPEAVRNGVFGNDVEKFVSFKPNDDRATNHYSSQTIFGHVTLEKKDSEPLVQPVLVKTQSRNAYPPQEFSDAMFHNEVLFYTRVLPSLRKYDKCQILSSSIPEFVYGRAIKGQGLPENLLVLKDLRQKGFRPCVHEHQMDETHIELVLDRLGKFHSLSYLWKVDDPVGFEAAATQIQKDFNVNGVMAMAGLLSKEAFRECTFRGVEPLQKESKYKDRLADLCAHCENAYEWIDKTAFDSNTEPLTVMNHGDFHFHNLMFKYDDAGKPYEVAFFDFATIRKCCPAIDLSEILIFSVSTELVRDRWSRLLRVYHVSDSIQPHWSPAEPKTESSCTKVP